MKIPKTIWIGPDEWTIKFRKLRNSYGKTHHYKRTILLNKNLKGVELEQTYCHELVHAIAMQMGWKDLDRSERRVESLGAVLAQILKQASESDSN